MPYCHSAVYIATSAYPKRKPDYMGTWYETVSGLRVLVNANQKTDISMIQTAKQAVYRRASGRGLPLLVEAAERL